MIANSSVRPHCSGVAATALVFVVAALACFPVRADNVTDAGAGDQPALPLALDNPEAVHRMHESIRNLKQLCIALHDWASAAPSDVCLFDLGPEFVILFELGHPGSFSACRHLWEKRPREISAQLADRVAALSRGAEPV